MSNKRKVSAGFLLIGLLLFISQMLFLQHLKTIEKNIIDVQVKFVPSAQLMGWMNGAVSDVPRLVYSMALEPDPTKRSRISNELEKLLVQIDDRKTQYEIDYLYGEEDQRLYSNFNRLWKKYKSHLPDIIHAIQANDARRAQALINDSMPLWEKANDSVDLLINYNSEASEIAAQRSVVLTQAAQQQGLLCMIIALILTLAIAVAKAKNILEAEEHLQNFQTNQKK